jgi:Iron-binding zinc finger CDGSH type
MKGQVALKFPAAASVEAGKTYYWCACGKSNSQPFCDGSHKGSQFTPPPRVFRCGDEVRLFLSVQANNGAAFLRRHAQVRLSRYASGML